VRTESSHSSAHPSRQPSGFYKSSKLAKASYREIYKQPGKGILSLTCQDFFFDAVNLTRVQQWLESFHPTKDHGFFEVAYFEYRVPAADRVYQIIYPAGYL